MNDDFINKALPKVRKDLAESLYKRISADSHRSAQTGMYPRRGMPRRLQAAIILLAVLVLVAWSQIRLWIRYVPIGDLWLIEFSSTQQQPVEQLVTPFVPTSAQAPTAIIEINGTKEVITIDWYRFEEYPSPDWIPNGFSATKILRNGNAYEEWLGLWSNDVGQTIRLFVVPKVGGARPYSPPGMYKEVYINDQAALLIYGRLAPSSPENPQTQRQWDETLGLQLSWSIEDYIYTLETLGPYVPEDDLIRMAESMKIAPPPGETATP